MAKKNTKPTPEAAQAIMNAKLEAMTTAIDKEFGKGTMSNLSGVQAMPHFPYQIPTGSVNLDLSIGIVRKLPSGVWQTGLPGGRVVEVFGPEGSGKSTLVAQIIANAQNLAKQHKTGRRCAMIDMEHAVLPSYWVKLGVDWDNLVYTQPNSGEEALRIAEMLLKTGAFDVIAVDSIAALVPLAEADANIGDSHMGLQARLMSQAMRILSPEINKPGINTIMLFTNQTREKIGAGGFGTTTPGGNAMKFYASFRVKTWVSTAIKNGEQKVGHVIGCDMIKNKIAPPYIQASVPLIYGFGIDSVMELFDRCVLAGIVAQNGSWYSFGNSRLGQGRESCIASIRSQNGLCYALYDLLLTKFMADQGYDPYGEPIPGFVHKISPVIADVFIPADTQKIVSEHGFVMPTNVPADEVEGEELEDEAA